MAQKEFIQSPRDALKVLLIGGAILWQTFPTLLGIVVYILAIRVFKVNRLVVLGAGTFLFLLFVSLQFLFHHFANIHDFISTGFWGNLVLWKHLINGDGVFGFYSYLLNGFDYFWGLPLFVGGILGVIDLMPNTPHEEALKAIHQKQVASPKEISEKRLGKLLNAVKDEDFNGTALGISEYTGKTIVVPDKYVNQVVMVLGTTGSGKSVTLFRFIERAMRNGYPVIFVTGKPMEKDEKWFGDAARFHQKKCYGFNCLDYNQYDVLADGGATELKDKIICLKDSWDSDHYKTIAEDYLQAVFEVLLQSKEPFDLTHVAQNLRFKTLLFLADSIDRALADRVVTLENYDQGDLTGLQAQLNTLIHSDLGPYLKNGDKTFCLSQVVKENAAVYFALPALRYPAFARVLGKLVANDIKTVIDRNQEKKVFIIFDEFSTFAGEQILNLINMGRSKGAHVIFGTQGLADLKKVDNHFSDQILNCVNTLICHRLNDQNSAEEIAKWIGTQDSFTLTAQINADTGDTGLGSVRQNKEFIVHPDQIKQGLRAGEAYYVTKIGQFRLDKVKIKMPLGL